MAGAKRRRRAGSKDRERYKTGVSGRSGNAAGEAAEDAAREAAAYERARSLACAGRYADAAGVYRELVEGPTSRRICALAQNDLAVLSAVCGEEDTALQGFVAAVESDPVCAVARENLLYFRETVQNREAADGIASRGMRATEDLRCPRPVRVAILSFLFNWPSTGGGIIHTVELADFLGRAGFEVRHFYFRYAPWDIGKLEAVLPITSEMLEFTESEWRVQRIQERIREAVGRFDPDHVIITDCWNMKPLLAEAVEEFPYILRQQALECLCPLNNLRLLPGGGGAVEQCPYDQLSAAHDCYRCLVARGSQSGGLHQAERELAEVGTEQYDRRLRRAFRDAEAVLALNPSIETLLKPFAPNARVVTWGMDPARFPWPPFEVQTARKPDGKKTILMAGVVEEFIKGFHILHGACEILWQKRHDFELCATGRTAGVVDEFTRFTGWVSQEELPRLIRAADMLVMPTIAQEGLGRTTVEAMGVGRPVIASRIGGLPFTVAEGVTGLLCEPGNPIDLAAKIECLLDNPDLCEQFGQAGRARFERDFTWPVVIERHYRPLLAARRRAGAC